MREKREGAKVMRIGGVGAKAHCVGEQVPRPHVQVDQMRRWIRCKVLLPLDQLH